MKAASRPLMGAGKRTVVTRSIATGMRTRLELSREMCMTSGAASTPCRRSASSSKHQIILVFIFELEFRHEHGLGTIADQVWVEPQGQEQLERHRLGEWLALDQPVAVETADHQHPHAVRSGFLRVDAADLRFLRERLVVK